jgi:hypothetical protein
MTEITFFITEGLISSKPADLLDLNRFTMLMISTGSVGVAKND